MFIPPARVISSLKQVFGPTVVIPASEPGVLKKEKKTFFFFADESYLPGIIGLIAGKLSNLYYKPSIIISQQKKFSKGSCRSIPELNITQALRKFSYLFEDIGGHSQAAGFTIKTSNINKLKKEIIPYVNQKLKKIKLEATTLVDAQMEIEAINLTNIKTIARLEPFGMSNPKPVFFFKNVSINDLRIIGSQKEHLKLRFKNIEGLAFNQADLFDKLTKAEKIDFIGYLDINSWQGLNKPQIIINQIII
jgi:single-stranded-DNA-specific exonuclease